MGLTRNQKEVLEIFFYWLWLYEQSLGVVQTFIVIFVRNHPRGVFSQTKSRPKETIYIFVCEIKPFDSKENSVDSGQTTCVNIVQTLVPLST